MDNIDQIKKECEESYRDVSHGLELRVDAIPLFRQQENGILTYTIYLFLLEKLGRLEDRDIKLYDEVVQNLQTYKKNGQQVQGLYDRGWHESDANHMLYVDPDKRRRISKDNVLAISSGSNVFNLPYRDHIVKWGWKYQGRFDNLNPDKPKWIVEQHHKSKKSVTVIWNPSNIYSLLSNSSYLIAKLVAIFLWPFALIANIISARSEAGETSGKLLCFVRVGNSKFWPSKLIWFICKKIMKKTYNSDYWFAEICKIYFPKEHPINRLAKLIKM